MKSVKSKIMFKSVNKVPPIFKITRNYDYQTQSLIMKKLWFEIDRICDLKVFIHRKIDNEMYQGGRDEVN